MGGEFCVGARCNAVAYLLYRILMYSAYVAPVGALDVGHRYGLPQLPDSDVILHSTVTDPVSQEALKMLVAAFSEQVCKSVRGRNKKKSPPHPFSKEEPGRHWPVHRPRAH